MKLHLKVLFLGVFILAVQSFVLPVEKCHLDDSKCMLPAYQKMIPMFFGGIPELGVEKMDKLNDVDFEISGLKLSVRNMNIKGMESMVMDKVQWDTKKKTIHLEFHFDCLLKGDYKAGGKILILPLDGDGKMKLKLKNLFISMDCEFDIEKKADGKSYLKFKNYKFDYEVKDKAEYRMTNLFKGNKELSDNIEEFMNEHWKEVTTECGRPMLEAVATQVFKNCNRFFQRMAISDVALL